MTPRERGFAAGTLVALGRDRDQPVAHEEMVSATVECSVVNYRCTLSYAVSDELKQAD
jgi:hypothetical protein